jgi:MFS family permease
VTQPLPPLAGAGAAPKSARGLIAAIACIAVFGVAAGMTHPLFALRLEQDGWSAAMIGLNGAMVALAALTLAPLMPRLVRAIGLGPFLALGAALAAAILLMFPLFEGYAAWLGLRFLLGGAATMLFLGSEAWIVSDADEGARGRVVGFYATVMAIGFSAGPMILGGVGFDGWTPFVVCAVLALAAIAPLASAWSDAPALHDEDGAGATPAWAFFRTDPTVMWAVTLFGAIEFGVLGLLPVWGVRMGLEREAASFLVSVLILGNVVFQIPLGALADRLNRRAMLIGCAATTIAAAVALPMAGVGGLALWAGLFVWGGLVAGLYTVALIELAARYRGASMVSATAAVMAAYGIGALGGPLLVGVAMDLVDPHGLSIALGAMATAYLGLAVRRARRRARAARSA